MNLKALAQAIIERKARLYPIDRQPADQPLNPQNGEFGLCQVCGEPAGLIVPSAVADKRRFCGIQCYRTAPAETKTAAPPGDPKERHETQ